jgi:hypothetical protein
MIFPGVSAVNFWFIHEGVARILPEFPWIVLTSVGFRWKKNNKNNKLRASWSSTESNFIQ